jgi:hypothetical protein
MLSSQLRYKLLSPPLWGQRSLQKSQLQSSYRSRFRCRNPNLVTSIEDLRGSIVLQPSYREQFAAMSAWR